MTQPATPMPQTWADLIEGITLLAKGALYHTYPFQCEHDTLIVCVDETVFTPDEIIRLEQLGFDKNKDGGFTSYRFGNA